MTKYNKTIHNAIVSTMRKGATITVAAKIAGIHQNTLRSWLVKGENDENSEYRQLWLDVQEAEGKVELDAIDFLSDCGDWKALQWLLSTRFRHTWGNKVEIDQKVTNTDVVAEIMGKLEAKLEPEIYKQVLSILAEG